MKKILLVVLLFWLADSAHAQTCNSIFPCFSPDGQIMYFSSDRHGSNYDIYKMNIDGTNLQRLTTSSVNNVYVSINPAGTKLLFQAGDYGSSAEIFIMDTDGSNLVQLTSNSVHDGFPNFSPDGNTIIFEAWDASPYPEVFTMDLTGGNRTQITNVSGAYWQSAPQYNPTGTKIYFSAGFNADNRIVMMDLNGSNWVDITDPNSFGYSEWGLHFSPDGQQIAFLTTEYVGYTNGSDLILADTTGDNWIPLTSSSGGVYYYYPVYHPTNGWIYYNCDSTGSWTLYHMDIDGTNPVMVSDCFGVGVSDIENESIAAYPNPASDFIYLRLPVYLPNGNYKISVFDNLGRAYNVSHTITGEKIHLSTKDLPFGMYFFKLQLDGGAEFTGKFLVK